MNTHGAASLATRIDSAVAAGIIDRGTADQLLPYLLQSDQIEAVADPDDERLRFVTGFNDVFVTIGLAMFLGALGYLTATAGAALSSLACALASWGLAEFFTRKRRMALPSIVLLLAFTYAVFASSFSALTGGSALTSAHITEFPLPLVAAGALTATAAWLHWVRFQVPITLAAGVCVLLVMMLAALTKLVPNLLINHPVIVFVSIGLLVFGLAMRFDMSDRMRQTRQTDIAFWLHLLAAPIIVHPVLMNASAGLENETSRALLVVGVFLVLSVIAILVDRRAILVSSLTYLGYAASSLVSAAGLSSSSFAYSALAVGSVVLLLSAAWRPLRRSILTLLPEQVREHVPPAS